MVSGFLVRDLPEVPCNPGILLQQLVSDNIRLRARIWTPHGHASNSMPLSTTSPLGVPYLVRIVLINEQK